MKPHWTPKAKNWPISQDCRLFNLSLAARIDDLSRSAFLTFSRLDREANLSAQISFGEIDIWLTGSEQEQSSSLNLRSGEFQSAAFLAKYSCKGRILSDVCFPPMSELNDF